MKVLKKGRAQKGWSKEYVCTGSGNGNGGCGAKLLVSKEDLYCVRLCYFDESETLIKFCCACCGVETTIKDRDAPWDVPEKTKWLKLHPKEER